MTETQEPQGLKTHPWLDEKTGQLKPEYAKKFAKIGGLLGVVVWGTVAVLAGIMFVSLGLWPIVVWPLVFYAYARHLGLALNAYQNVVKPKTWEQHVVVNVISELSPEQIAEAAAKAVADEKYWALQK